MVFTCHGFTVDEWYVTRIQSAKSKFVSIFLNSATCLAINAERCEYITPDTLIIPYREEENRQERGRSSSRQCPISRAQTKGGKIHR